jgi:hypothetical protein
MSAATRNSLPGAISLIQQWRDKVAGRRDVAARLLTDSGRLLEKRWASRKADIERLLGEANPHFRRIKQEQQLSAPHFNVFAALCPFGKRA